MNNLNVDPRETDLLYNKVPKSCKPLCLRSCPQFIYFYISE